VLPRAIPQPDFFSTLLGASAYLPLPPGSVRGATIASATADSKAVVITGNLDGFSAEEIQSLNLGATRLLLADGTALPLSGGSHGNGQELKDFTLWFDLPDGSAVAVAVDLAVEASAPSTVKDGISEGTLANLEALEAAGVQHLMISLQP